MSPRSTGYDRGRPRGRRGSGPAPSPASIAVKGREGARQFDSPCVRATPFTTGSDRRMVRIRMKSFGRRHRPFFRICAMDARTPRDGTAIEELGYYDPLVRNVDGPGVVQQPRIRYWLSVGAQPSEKVAGDAEAARRHQARPRRALGNVARGAPATAPRPRPDRRPRHRRARGLRPHRPPSPQPPSGPGPGRVAAAEAARRRGPGGRGPERPDPVPSAEPSPPPRADLPMPPPPLRFDVLTLSPACSTGSCPRAS